MIAERLLKHPTQAQHLADPKQCRRISTCMRGTSAQGLSAALPQITAFAANIAAHLPPYKQIIDIAYFPAGEVWLVEVNPGLMPKDLALFT